MSLRPCHWQFVPRSICLIGCVHFWSLNEHSWTVGQWLIAYLPSMFCYCFWLWQCSYPFDCCQPCSLIGPWLRLYQCLFGLTRLSWPVRSMLRWGSGQSPWRGLSSWFLGWNDPCGPCWRWFSWICRSQLPSSRISSYCLRNSSRTRMELSSLPLRIRLLWRRRTCTIWPKRSFSWPRIWEGSVARVVPSPFPKLACRCFRKLE